MRCSYSDGKKKAKKGPVGSGTHSAPTEKGCFDSVLLLWTYNNIHGYELVHR